MYEAANTAPLWRAARNGSQIAGDWVAARRENRGALANSRVAVR